MWAWISKVVGKVARRNIGAGVLVSCDHVGDYIIYMLLEHCEVTVVIEMVVGE